MTTQNQVLNLSLPADADLSDNQFFCVTLNASEKVAVVAALGAKVLGLLQNDPDAADKTAVVAVLGVAKGIAGGTITAFDPVGPDAAGELITMDEEDEAVLGRAMESAVDGQILRVFLTHEGSAAAVSGVDAFLAAANYSSTGQYLAVKAHTTGGEAILIAAAQDDILGILQNAPAAGATALVKTYGVATAQAGSGGVTAGDRVAVASTAKLITATTGKAVGFALETLNADATGDFFIMPQWLLDMTGQTLASTNIFVGDGSNLAAAVAMSGDATMDNTGAVTIADNAVSAAKMGSTVAGSDGAIFKSSQTPDAVTELDVPVGNIVVGTSGDVGLLDMGAAAGNIMVDDGTVPASVAVSQDATLAAGGALSVSDLTIASEAQGDLLRRGAAAWERVAAKTSGQILVGDGSDVVSVAVGGDIGLDATGDTEVSDLTMATEARGDILRRGAAAWEVLDASTDGQILVGDGNDPVSVPLSGDATLINSGAMTLAKGFMRQITTTWTVAQIKAGNATPLVLADFGVLETAGLVASGDALIFHHLIANIYGGGVNYDQNQNNIIKYQTAGGGADVSLTLANWLDANGPGAITDMKQLATVVVPDADEDLVWTMSASPYNAAGDRLLQVTLYYSVYTPAT